VILVPVILVSSALVLEIDRLVRGAPVDLPAWRTSVIDTLGRVPGVGGFLADRLSAFLADPAAIEAQVTARVRGLAETSLTLLGSVGHLALDALVTLVTLGFLYRHGHRLGDQMGRVVERAGGERMSGMFALVARTVRAVTYGTLLTAVTQGALIMLGCWATGVRAPVLLGAIAGLLALTPIGTPLVYVPVAIALLLERRYVASGLLLAWGVLVVGTADNVIRTWIVSGAARIPVFFSLFGALGGLVAFGPLGLFVGPVALALALTLWREWTEPGLDT
jgi:predicted PurR-regulated permease PerM